jgi:hypothetical protein
MRYERQAFGWWFHDVVVHPISGTIGLVGNLTRSFRLMALAHHLHNGSAPSNDAVADYIAAAARACDNETSGNPRGSMTPDEQAWVREQARIATGRQDIPFEEAVSVVQAKGIKVWDNQARGGKAPALLSKTEVEEGREERLLERQLEEAEAEYSALMSRTFNHYEIRDMGDEGKEALRAQAIRLYDKVARARKALAKKQRGLSVRELLGLK